MKKDHPDLSVRRQCSLLSLARSTLYYQPRGESAENLKFMEINSLRLYPLCHVVGGGYADDRGL